MNLVRERVSLVIVGVGGQRLITAVGRTPEKGQNAQPVFLAIDNGRWVILADAAARLHLQGLRHAPRFMYVTVGHVSQLGEPAADIAAGRVVLLALGCRAEDAEIGGSVGTGPCDPLPVAVVHRQVAVEQVAAEPALAQAPVEQ
jgi:hypothetical protein